MVTGFITSGQTDREIVMDFIFLGSKTTTDIDCSHEIKRHLILGRKAMTNIDSILKSRNIAFPLKVRVVKCAVFPVVMYRCESSSIKKIEHWGIRAFKLVLEKILESLLVSKELKSVDPKGNQPWIVIERTDTEAEVPNTLATWFKKLTHWKTHWS